MKKVALIFLLALGFTSFFAIADDDDDDDDFRAAFSQMEKERMKMEMQRFWNKDNQPHAPPLLPPPKPPTLDSDDKKDLKRGIQMHNVTLHWERRCRDAQEAPPREWQKFLYKKWPKKLRKLHYMANVGDLHPSAAADYYLFGAYTDADWEQFRASCQNGMPPAMQAKMESLGLSEIPVKKRKKRDFPR